MPRSLLLRAMVIPAFLLLFTACTSHRPTTTTAPALPVVRILQIHDRNPLATVNFKINGDTLYVHAISPTGIGGTRLELQSGKWPRQLVVDFSYAPKKPFKVNEGSSASLEDSATKPNTETYLKASDYTPSKIVFTIPASDLKILYINWVDALRH